MIRFVVGLLVFAVALCAYIVTRPYDDGRRSFTPPQAAVTRAGTDTTIALPSSDVVATVAAPAPVPLPVPAPMPVPAPGHGLTTNSDPLTLTIANVLIGLGLDSAALGPIGTRARGPETELEFLILQSLQARDANGDIDRKVNAAARAGDVTVPDVLVRADGTVDTPVLLEAIIAQAAVAAGQPAPVPQPGATVEPYRVSAADSLAGIALRIYGDVSRTDALLVTNPMVLSTADRLEPGQVLTLPPL